MMAIQKSWLTCLTVLSLMTGVAVAEDAAQKGNGGKTSDPKSAPVQPATGPFAVPKDASPEKLLRFVKSLLEMEPILLSRADAVAHFEKVSTAMMEATDRILKTPNVNEDTAAGALDFRFVAINIRGKLGQADADKEELELAEKYREDKRPAVARIAREKLLFTNLLNFSKLKPQGQEKLADEALAFVKDLPKPRAKSMSLIMTIARLIERGGNDQLSTRTYEELATFLGHSDEPAAAEMSERFEKAANRMKLLGKPIEIEGQLTTGKAVDWSAYRGKVVLVDFWATWCEVCVAEMPELVKLHQEFGPKGFEVLGVSMDGNKDKLDVFLTKNNIPWDNLFNFDETQPEHPLAAKLGVGPLPQTYLVGKDGKLIKMNLRGEDLRATLVKLLGPPVNADQKPAAKGE